MKTEQHRFIVKGTNPPVIEVDSQARAVYVRFKRAAVAKTIPQESEHMLVAVDLDSRGEVVGIEAVGLQCFTLHALLKMASVKVPNMDFSRAQYTPTEPIPA
ncbi:MAG: DUF2283 domain-containing protein [Verrucomicrobiota bacterium]|jgi:uncharacterized protein YuzE